MSNAAIALAGLIIAIAAVLSSDFEWHVSEAMRLLYATEAPEPRYERRPM